MNITTLYQQAELAQAAYAKNLLPGAPSIRALTDAGMTQTQAEAFAKEWRVVDQYTAPADSVPIFGEVTGSGFSATIFQNIETKQYVFAIRGTEASNMNDLVDADASHIGFDGLALPQAIDLYNYLQSLNTPKRQAYMAAYLDPVGSATTILAGESLDDYWVKDGIAYRLEMGLSTEVLAGSGLETGRQTATVQLGSGYDVVGHSLGGHLAMILGRLDGADILYGGFLAGGAAATHSTIPCLLVCA